MLKVGILCFWASAPQFSSPQYINDPFVVNVNHIRTDSFPEKTLENRDLSSPDSTLVAPQVRHPAFRLVPSSHHDNAAQMTTHVHLTCPRTPNREPPVVAWSRKPSADVLQLLCASDSHLWTVKCLFFWSSPLRGCDVIPLCHFQSSF